MSNRYETRIANIINDSPRTRMKTPLHWYDFADLAATIHDYLNAKMARASLTASEQQLLTTTGRALAIDNGEAAADDIYLAASFPKLARLNCIIAEERTSWGHFTQDINQEMADFEQRTVAVRKIGESLEPATLSSISMQPRQDWVALPFLYFEELLTGYSQTHQLTTNDLIMIFGGRMVQAYWPLSQALVPDAPLSTFFNYLRESGDWLLDLIDQFSPLADHNITTLTILWLQWYKHEKTFHGFEEVASAQNSIRQAKRISQLLCHQEYEAAGQLLIQHLPGFWD